MERDHLTHSVEVSTHKGANYDNHSCAKAIVLGCHRLENVAAQMGEHAAFSW